MPPLPAHATMKPARHFADRAGLGSARRWLAAALLAAGVWSVMELDLDPAGLAPGRGGLAVAAEFFGSALRPALSYGTAVPPGTRSLPVNVAHAIWETVLFAAAAMGLAVLAGALFGTLASGAFWFRFADPIRDRARWRQLPALLLLTGTRTFIALLRSIHELLWAVLFLAAMGLNRISAVVALALPCAGMLAKIFAELVDEAPPDAADAIRAAGGTRLQAFFFGLVPRALPDLLAYTLYRFECTLRSAAVMGFFGYPTLGFYLAAAFENLRYAEVWTYLYALIALIAISDWWSGMIRRRLA